MFQKFKKCQKCKISKNDIFWIFGKFRKILYNQGIDDFFEIIIVIILATGEKDLVATGIPNEETCFKILEQTHVVKGLRYRCVKQDEQR